ncbi:MAG TPA: xanthine dehydrogenase family protein subunit M [Beijerinckiaceae bacterium]|nr:xanthine dehydrogenase family protein subunit M [Beijerinckiaceae bacterium]
MKAPAFDYVRARSLPEALSLLQQHGEAAKIIAGGQSLVPALNLRLVTPALLVDIGGLAELKGIAVKDGVVRIGALTRHVELQRAPDIARHTPLIAEAITHVAHPAIRNRGTIGGSLAQADPASELPACAVALQATIVVAGPQGERRIPADDFFRGLYETALSPHDVLVAVEVPAIRPGERSAFLELARRSGDYALVGLACHAGVADAALRELRLAYFAVGTKPTLATNAARCLVGAPLSGASIADAQEALAQDLAPQDDIHASAATRRQLARVLLRRALAELLPEAAMAERKRA